MSIPTTGIITLDEIIRRQPLDEIITVDGEVLADTTQHIQEHSQQDAIVLDLRLGKEYFVFTFYLLVEAFSFFMIIWNDLDRSSATISLSISSSITACAEGISLTAASRVIMLDSEWNPSKTKQAIARAFRPGQQKVVYVYQLLVTGSLEEDKYKRTTWKEWVSSMIFSEAFEQNPSHSRAVNIEDDILREMVEEDKSKTIHMILKSYQKL